MTRAANLSRALSYLGAALLGASLLTACEDSQPISVIEEPPDAGCGGAEEPRRYEVYFALDVSGSMAPFLRDVRDELEGFATGFPEFDRLGHGVRVDYFLVGFVNDFKVFGEGRMSSTLAIQSALDDAIEAGSNETNLTSNTPNVETEENLLDALAVIPGLSTATGTAAVKVVIIATDAEFAENPQVLGPNIRVAHTYAEVRQSLADISARVHVFTRASIPGLNIPYKNQPPLADLPGSSTARLDELTGARDKVRARLNEIAQGAICTVQRAQ